MAEQEVNNSIPTSLVLARLGEFFGHRTSWHRRLWNVGSNLALHEVIEYADGCLSGTTRSTEGLRYVIGTVKRQVDRDPGIAPLACEIASCLNALSVSSPSKIPVASRDELEQLARRLAKDYPDNWCTANDPPVEFAARALASHLLDLGFSPDHLHRWITAVRPELRSMDQLTEATRDMVARMPSRSYTVFVPCAAPFDKPNVDTGPVRWLDGHAASAWIRK